MHVIFIFALFHFIRGVVNYTHLSTIKVRNVTHRMIVLEDFLSSPYQLAIDYETNTIFFSRDTERDYSSESAYLDLKKDQSYLIHNIPAGFSNAVDNKNHIVYLGGRNGVYKYDYGTESAIFYGAKGKSVWQLFFKDYLYFTEYFTEIAYVFSYNNRTHKEVPQLKGENVLVMGIDKHDTIYFSNSKGLFKVLMSDSFVIKIGDWNAIAFTTDIDGNLFFCTNRSLYAIVKDEVVHLVTLPSVYGMAIDKNGEIIYSTPSQIIRLKPDGQYNCTSEYYKLLNINFS